MPNAGGGKGGWRYLAALLALHAAAADAADAPLTLGASYITDLIGDVDGGIRRGFVWLGRGDATAALDGDALGLPGTEAFVDVMAVQSPDFSGRHVGDAQVVSNVQADSAVRPMEAWISHGFGPFAAKAGLIDLNTEFDVQHYGAMFLNSSFGVGPDFSQSGVNGPSIFPAASSAAVLRYQGKSWAVRLGLFDGTAGSVRNPRAAALRLPGTTGLLLAAEVERKLPADAELQIGGWHYTRRAPALDGGAPAVSQGVYGQVEKQLLKRAGPTLDGWVRIGVAAARANPIGTYVGGGLTWGTDASRIGLAIAHARLGAPALRADPSQWRAETAIELSYLRQVAPPVAIQPDVQYVIHPGWARSLDHALVAGLRLRFGFSSGLALSRPMRIDTQ